MQVKHLDHVNLTVRNFDETVAWYGNAFGFEKVEESVTDGVRWGVIRSGDAMLCVYERPDFEFLDRFQLAERELYGMAHFALRISDVDDWLAAVERHGIEIQYGGEVEWPHSRSWYVFDPTGYEIEVVFWQEGTIRFDPLQTAATGTTRSQ